eukprot:2059966-Prymnesium_polylepis.1
MVEGPAPLDEPWGLAHACCNTECEPSQECGRAGGARRASVRTSRRASPAHPPSCGRPNSCRES